MVWELVLERRLEYAKNRRNTEKSLEAVLKAAKSLGLDPKIEKVLPRKLTRGADTERYQYRAVLTLVGLTQESNERIRQAIARAALKGKWNITHLRHREAGSILPSAQRPPFVVPELTDEVFRTHFAGVYERNAHIRIIHRAVSQAAKTGWKKLDHVLLYGEPGSCKTKLCECFTRWYEEQDQIQRVAFVDGTTMTKAGLENWLMELVDRNSLPKVVVVDELEKQPKDNLLCLLSVMGSGRLTRCNARTGNRCELTELLVIGICNDKEALIQFRRGVLWSRFTHELPCTRPSKDLCRLILREMAEEIPGGKPEWADKALEFGWDGLGQRDIRKIKGHLNGEDGLLDGSWQRDHLAISQAADKERGLRSLPLPVSPTYRVVTG